MDPTSSAASNENPSPTEPQWKPLSAKQRRVLGTLMEKSKTTPDAYPMTYSGLTTGCNQKSNREPISNYTSDQIEAIVDELRELGAAAIVQGSGRVTKVRHYAYNWLELSKVEAAVITELLLRGEQTIGELRTRASRMEPIQDLTHMQQIFDELKRRNLVVELTSAGRGQIVSHNLYPEWELTQLQQRTASKGGSVAATGDDEGSPTGARASSQSPNSQEVTELAAEVAFLKETLAKTIARLAYLEKEVGVSLPEDTGKQTGTEEN